MSVCFVDADSYFWPAARLILSITNTNPTIVTTTYRIDITSGVLVATAQDHDYQTGLIVRMNIPKACGMQELNKYVGSITVIDSTTFSLDVDSSLYEPFSIPLNPFPAWTNICAQVVPIAESNVSLAQAVHNIRG